MLLHAASLLSHLPRCTLHCCTALHRRTGFQSGWPHHLRSKSPSGHSPLGMSQTHSPLGRSRCGRCLDSGSVCKVNVACKAFDNSARRASPGLTSWGHTSVQWEEGLLSDIALYLLLSLDRMTGTVDTVPVLYSVSGSGRNICVCVVLLYW